MAQDVLGTAQFLLQSGRVLEARDVLAGAAGQGSAPVHSLLGLVLHQLGDLPGCHRELRQAVRLAPQDGAAVDGAPTSTRRGQGPVAERYQ